MEDEIYKCPQCKKECMESEFLEDDYAQYKGFSDDYSCPNCGAVVE